MHNTQNKKQAAAVQLWKGRSCSTPKYRPDIDAFSAKEKELYNKLKSISLEHTRTNNNSSRETSTGTTTTETPTAKSNQQINFRPSALSPLAILTTFTLGAATALLPRTASAAVLAGVQSALEHQYNENLRQLHEAGLATQASALRTAIREARDTERVPEGAPEKVPDLVDMAMNKKVSEVSVDEGIAAVVGFGLDNLLSAGRRV